MPRIGDRIQETDWKKENPAPVIECTEQVKVEPAFEVKVSLGKEIAHLNTTEHHIAWISLYEKYIHAVGGYEFAAHGESTEGPNLGSVYFHHEVTAHLKIMKTGTLHTVAYCNLHGLWESFKDIHAV